MVEWGMPIPLRGARHRLLLLLVTSWLFGLLALAAGASPPEDPAAPGRAMRWLAPDVLELEWIEARGVGGGEAQPWPWTTPAAALKPPGADDFVVRAGGSRVPVAAVGFKRRALRASLQGGEITVGAWVYLKLARPLAVGEGVSVEAPARAPGSAADRFELALVEQRVNPAIHVNQVGYLPDAPKLAMVGYYLGSLGELAVPAAAGFRILDAGGRVIHEGRLTPRPDRGYTYAPAPYQQVYAADFSAVRRPGMYRLWVPGLGVSPAFRIDDGVAMGFARAYALGLYHQRCGAELALPFTRFTHAACHLAPAQVPVPAIDFPFVWRTLAARSAGPPRAPGAAPVIDGEAALLFPFVRRGTVDVRGGHHDAGDYGKYTINSASFIHVLLFAVDAVPGAAADNLGLPESGDGVPDLLQVAKWEADFLSRMQDEDGGFHFLVYPRDRAYENDVTPDRGDPQVVWPKNTSATAAAVAALAQASSSPAFRRAYPAAAEHYLAQARRGWEFLTAALARFGPKGAYQRITHYGDTHQHDDELAWAAAELFLATGEQAVHDRFRAWCRPSDAAQRRWGWWRLNESWGNAIRSYGFAARIRGGRPRLDPTLEQACLREIEAAGRDALRWSEENAYGTSLPAETKRMRGGGWHFSLDRAFDLAVAALLDYPRRSDPRARLRAAFLANLNYEAGVNPVNISLVTGLGWRRPRQIVHQFAENDSRVLPPSGLPIGNLQAGLPYLPAYGGELGALSYPEDGAAAAPYPYYDRWTDVPNVTTEFVIVNQARALAGLLWLATGTEAATRPWRPVAGRIEGLPAAAEVGAPVTVRLVVPAGMDLAGAGVGWETAGQAGAGGETFTFTPRAHGAIWVEAEATWPDGRRVFAAATTAADDGRPVVSVTATRAVAAVANGGLGVLRFSRTGTTTAPLTVRFQLKGSAAKWSDYRRPEGDMPVEIVIPAGRESVDMAILPRAEGLGDATRELRLVLRADDAYNVGTPGEATVSLQGTRR